VSAHERCVCGRSYAGSRGLPSYALWLRDHASCEAITGHSGDELGGPSSGYQDRANAMCVESGKSVSDLR